MKWVKQVLIVMLFVQSLSVSVFADVTKKEVGEKEKAITLVNEVETSQTTLEGEVYDVKKRPLSKGYQLNNEMPVEYKADIKQLGELQYLVPKTKEKYEVLLSNDNGTYTFVKATSSYEEAISIAKATSKEDAIPAVMNQQGVIVYALNSMGRIVKMVNGQVYPSTNKNTNVYTTSALSSAFTYINHGYVDDVPIFDSTGKATKIEVNGYTGWINSDSTATEYDLIVVPMNRVTNPSYYENVNGELIHFISSNLEASPGTGFKIPIGPAPSYLSRGVKYYSYDGSYFYRDLNTLMEDGKANHHNNAVNRVKPFYNYYQFLSFRSKTSFSAQQINDFIQGEMEKRGGKYLTSKLLGIGDDLISAQNAYGVNALTILGVAINESAWGTSKISQEKNNLFGLNAVDSNTGNASSYFSVKDCVNDFAKSWISKGYANPSDWRYYGAHLGNKSTGTNIKYASDPFWGEKASQYSYTADKVISGNNLNWLKEHNRYNLAILKGTNEVYDNNWSKLYNVSNRAVNGSVIVQSTTPTSWNGVNWYMIEPEITTASGFDGRYNWDTIGYVKTSNVQLLHNQVPKDDVAPEKPLITRVVTDVDEQVKGTAEARAIIQVQVGTKVIGSNQADAKGNFTVKIPKQRAGVVLKLYAQDDSGNKSVAATTTIANTALSIQTTAVTDMKKYDAGSGKYLTYINGRGYSQFYYENLKGTYQFIPQSWLTALGLTVETRVINGKKMLFIYNPYKETTRNISNLDAFPSRTTMKVTRVTDMKKYDAGNGKHLTYINGRGYSQYYYENLKGSYQFIPHSWLKEAGITVEVKKEGTAKKIYLSNPYRK